MQESAIWVDETQSVLNQLGRRGNTSPLSGKEDEDPLGLSDEGTKARSEEEMLELFPECKYTCIEFHYYHCTFFGNRCFFAKQHKPCKTKMSSTDYL